MIDKCLPPARGINGNRRQKISQQPAGRAVEAKIGAPGQPHDLAKGALG